MPMKNLLADTQYDASRHDCDLFFARLNNLYGNDVRLGDAFFSAFLPIFDVESDMLGLAVNSRALDGVTITAAVDPEPEPTPESETISEPEPKLMPTPVPEPTPGLEPSIEQTE